MEKRKYSVIVFDLGNVLLPFNYDTALRKLERVDPELGTTFWNFYMNNYKIHRGFERGDIPEEDFINTMLSVLDNKIDKQTFCEYYSQIFSVNEEVAALLPELKKEYMLMLLSNTNSIHMEYGWKNYEFLSYFDKLILSHQVNSLKPEEKIYKTVEAHTQKPPQEHIFIDDVEEYVESAKSCGWDGIQFKSYNQLKAALHERNII